MSMPVSTQRWLLGLSTLALLLGAGAVLAHDQSVARINLALIPGGAQGEWAVAVPDLQRSIPLDSNGDAGITWGELRQARPRLQARLNRALQLRTAVGACRHQLRDLLVEKWPNGHFAVLRFDSHCSQDATPRELDYRFLAHIDALHLASYRIEGTSGVLTGTLSEASPRVGIDTTTAAATPLSGGMIAQGIIHVAMGPDHLLFLLVILLPLFARNTATGGRALSARQILRKVTAYTLTFTIAHSITLALAALHVIRLPVSWVELGIALTVAYGAWNAMGITPTPVRLPVVFLFGLVHGLGFAAVLAPIMQGSTLPGALLAFNLGVELGQLAFVAGIAPLLFWLSRWRRLPWLPAGAAAVLCVSLVWIAQRAAI
jgi:hypothetical protein